MLFYVEASSDCLKHFVPYPVLAGSSCILPRTNRGGTWCHEPEVINDHLRWRRAQTAGQTSRFHQLGLTTSISQICSRFFSPGRVFKDIQEHSHDLEPKVCSSLSRQSGDGHRFWHEIFTDPASLGQVLYLPAKNHTAWLIDAFTSDPCLHPTSSRWCWNQCLQDSSP